MRNIKLKSKLLKASLVATPITLLTFSPLTSCAKKQEPKVESVKITSEINDITVDLGQEFKSLPILSQCYDKNDKEIKEKQPALQIFSQDGNPIPPWINLNNKNQICLYKQIGGGSWTFYVQANYEEIKSEPIYFNVNLVDQKLCPDRIEITCPDEFDILAPASEYFNINLVAYKDEQISVICNKNCSWKITKLVPLNPDVKIPSFSLEDLKTSACLYCSVDHATASIGEFEITIQAQSDVNPDLVCEKIITVCVTDGQDFTDPETGYSYRRMSSDTGWVLFKIPESTSEIKDVKSEIQGIPVYKVYDFLCYITEGEVGKIKSIDLPSSITCIGQYAFANQKNIESVCMPGVKTVETYAFSNCIKMSLSKAKPEPQIEEAASYCFQNCSNLKINLYQPTTYVRLGAYKNSGVESIYFTKKLYKIEDKAFENCTNLVSFTVNRLTPPFLNGDPFKNVNSAFKIYVPQSDINDYLTCDGWKNYKGKIVGF